MLVNWTTKEQRIQLEQYLAHNTPSSSSNLGYHLLNEQVGIWTTHEDPINTTDIVVWIWDYKEGIRVLVSTEFVLDSAELTPEAKDHVYGDNRNNADITIFTSKEDEALYRESLKVLEHVMTSFTSQRGIDEPIFGDVNLLWLPVFYKHMRLDLDLPHCKLAKQASVPLPTIEIPDHLELATISTEQDILTVQSNNKYTFSYEYIKDCSRLSSTIRRKDNKALVAWAMTHSDLSVGALYVLPEYRRQGLAEAVVADISRVYVNYYQQRLPDVSLSQLYFNVFIERTNIPSLQLFEKSGFKPLSLGVSRIRMTGCQ